MYKICMTRYSSWFILEFPQLELKQLPTLWSFGLTRRTLIYHPLPASIPLQEKDTLLPAAASCKQKPSHHQLPILAQPAACPSPTQSPCMHPPSSGQGCQRPSALQFVLWAFSLQKWDLEPGEGPCYCPTHLILWLWCFPKKLPYWYTLRHLSYECAPQRSTS